VTLAETQALLHEVITSGREVGDGRIDGCLASRPSFTGKEGAEVYANMYLWRLVDALRDTYPALARHLGDQTFASLATDYLQAHPSGHHDIGQAGRRLPAFLRRHPDPGQPWLGDLASLEWARHRAFFPPPATAVGPEVIVGLGPDAVDATGLALAPSLRILRLGNAVEETWRRLIGGEAPEPPAAMPSAVAVWRSGFEVHHCALPLDEAAALEDARRGRSLARICSAFAGREDPAAAASGAIASWFTEGWIVGRRTAGGGDQVSTRRGRRLDQRAALTGRS